MKKWYNEGTYIAREQLGKELEGEIIYLCKTHFEELNEATAFVCTVDSDADQKEGTDAVIWGVPTDFTCNFYGKDHMQILKAVVDLPKFGLKVRFGIRTGNNHNGGTQFKTPVLVIGVDGCDTSFLRTWMENILSEIKNALDEIVDVGQDQYWSWCDANGI